MRMWIRRCVALIAMALVLAIADAALRPFPSQHFAKKQAPPPKVEEPAVSTIPSDGVAVSTPVGPNESGEVSDIAWVRGKYESQSHHFVDARPIDQYREGHLAGAFHLDFAAFQAGTPTEKMDVLRGQPVIVYCSGGDCDASHKVQTMLQRYGLVEVYVFVPGYPAFAEAGFPIEQGDPLF